MILTMKKDTFTNEAIKKNKKKKTEKIKQEDKREVMEES